MSDEVVAGPTMSDGFEAITEYGDYGPRPGEETVAVPCPACGTVVRFGSGYWERTMGTRCDRWNDGRKLRTVVITGIWCRECEAMSPVRAWHRAKEAQAIAAAGFVTGRAMKAVEVSS